MKQTETATGTNSSELCALFKCTKETARNRRWLQSIGRGLDHPTPTAEDNAATITQVLKDRLTPEVKHLDVMVCWLHEQYKKHIFYPIPTKTCHMRADVNSKPHGGETLQKKVLPLFGFPFYPPADSDHYKQLELDKYNIGYHCGSFRKKLDSKPSPSK